MSRAPRPLLPGARAAGPPTYEMLKEEHEVVVLGSGAPQSAAPATTTVINICGDTVVPDHVVWSLFNTVFMNWCCLGFMALLLLREGQGLWKMAGDLTGAQSFASHRQVPQIWALVLGLLLTVTFVILVSTGSLVIFENSFRDALVSIKHVPCDLLRSRWGALGDARGPAAHPRPVAGLHLLGRVCRVG
ncbi:interferon-induced transmembrane protein 1-like isoform X1 [Canis lupus familiaris]|uniref:interferon-induced transmembrane protein 1-like isoform X1 n=1 Tax=Canis lupus familiaris TaxID=9615 RepID=UPI0018F7DF58|nr:interferon-induced transmembrane protein 1-like isoform X1 [Canis lupus familiaris]